MNCQVLFSPKKKIQEIKISSAALAVFSAFWINSSAQFGQNFLFLLPGNSLSNSFMSNDLRKCALAQTDLILRCPPAKAFVICYS